jgi:hypothetical protein
MRLFESRKAHYPFTLNYYVSISKFVIDFVNPNHYIYKQDIKLIKDNSSNFVQLTEFQYQMNSGGKNK